MSRKLEECERHHDPFPYLVVPKLLPRMLAQRLSCSFPTELMRAMPAERTGNIYAHKHRSIFNLNQSGLSLLPDDTRDLWTIFHDAISALAPKLLAALPDAPANQRARDWKREDLVVRIDLWEDSAGYQILPHSEAPHKFANFLLYLSDDPALEGEGTALYTPKDPQFRCWSGQQLAREQFNLYKKAPYRHNLMFGFRKTDLSFHGKDMVATRTMPRRTVSMTIQDRNKFVA